MNGKSGPFNARPFSPKNVPKAAAQDMAINIVKNEFDDSVCRQFRLKVMADFHSTP
jgi:hypothetical protein